MNKLLLFIFSILFLNSNFVFSQNLNKINKELINENVKKFELFQKTHHIVANSHEEFLKKLKSNSKSGNVQGYLDSIAYLSDGNVSGSPLTLIMYDLFSHDSLDRLKSMLTYSYNTDSMKCVLNNKIECSYSADNLTSTTLISPYDYTSNEFDTFYYFIDNFNSNGLLIKTTLFLWSCFDTTDIWEYTYDTLNRKTSMIHSSWDMNLVLIPQVKEYFQYQGINSVESYYNCLYFNEQTAQWHSAIRDTTLFNLQHNPTIRTEYEWKNNNWVKTTRNEIQYDITGNFPIIYLASNWNSGLNSFVYESKFKYSYNSLNDIDTMRCFYFDTIQNIWYSTEIRSYIKSNTYFTSDFNIYNIYEPSIFNNLLLSSYNLIIDSNSMSLIPGSKVLYFYKYNSSVGMETPENMKFEIFPNPATNTITIKLNNNHYFSNGHVQIFNIQGKLVKEIHLKEEMIEFTIDVSHFISGLYLGKIIKGNEEILSFKFVKE